MQYSQTQLANIATFAGLITMILAKFGKPVDPDSVAFFIGAIGSIGFTIYNYVQRYKKGDLTIGGWRK